MTPLEQLKSVLCDPAGKCCISGSEADRAVVDSALAYLALPVQSAPLNHKAFNYWLDDVTRNQDSKMPTLRQVWQAAIKSVIVLPVQPVQPASAWMTEKDDLTTDESRTKTWVRMGLTVIPLYKGVPSTQPEQPASNLDDDVAISVNDAFDAMWARHTPEFIDGLDKRILAFGAYMAATRAATAQPEQPAPVAQAEPTSTDSRDAERYRWLRRGPEASDGELYIGVDSDKFKNRWALEACEADAAIDAAIQAKDDTP